MAEKILEEETPKSIEEIEAFYNQINESIIELWQEEGRHALLHHLNAIFGYEPLAVYEKRFLKF